MSRSAVRRAMSLLAMVVALLAVQPAAVSATTPSPDPGGDTPATAAPDTAPVTVTTPGTLTPDGGGGGDDVPWPLIIAGGAALIALIALVAALSRRGSSGGGSTAQTAPSPAAHHDQASQERGYALGSAQWVHDNFSVELLAAGPETAMRRWNADRARLDDATIRAQRFSADPRHGVAWQSLAQSLSLLSSSLDTQIQLRNADTPDDQLIREATDVVHRHRAQLSRDIATLWPTVQS